MCEYYKIFTTVCQDLSPNQFQARSHLKTCCQIHERIWHPKRYSRVGWVAVWLPLSVPDFPQSYRRIVYEAYIELTQLKKTNIPRMIIELWLIGCWKSWLISLASTTKSVHSQGLLIRLKGRVRCWWRDAVNNKANRTFPGIPTVWITLVMLHRIYA